MPGPKNRTRPTTKCFERRSWLELILDPQLHGARRVLDHARDLSKIRRVVERRRRLGPLEPIEGVERVHPHFERLIADQPDHARQREIEIARADAADAIALLR